LIILCSSSYLSTFSKITFLGPLKAHPSNSSGFFNWTLGKFEKNKGSATSAMRVFDIQAPAQK